MTSYPIRMAALVAAAAAVVAVSSCSTSTQSSPASPSTTATQAASGHNMADVMFAHMMIPHHQQALDLSALVPDRSTNQELITLAATIASEQQPEIDQMQAMLTDWGAMPGMSNMPGHGGMGDMPGMGDMGDMGGMGGMGMSGMIDAATVTKLTSLSGQPFDVLWLQSMIVHHQGAIEMAQNEVADGSNPGMVNLAKGMVTAQQAEIDQMQRMLAELGG